MNLLPLQGDLKSARTTLEFLAQGEMRGLERDVDGLPSARKGDLPARLLEIRERQSHVHAELLALLGRLARSRGATGEKKDVSSQELPPDSPPYTREAVQVLKEDIQGFTRSQRKILELTRSILENGPEDLTQAEERILGKLAREEADWARFLEEKLTDFSKLPQQDFASFNLSDEFNEVFQEVKLAAKSLYDKKLEIAVPQEQSGLENAEKMLQNIERWLPDTPDHEKWNMEEPLGKPDTALADLPSELEDIVGDLLDKEEEMSEDIEDVTSSWLDSIDKGAGWDAADGPISNMSARGVTGNRLPNQMEVGGRSGEGRTGRSHGQFVEKTAEGKAGGKTPARLTPSPFEQGSVEDKSGMDGGGATGGGKVSGASAPGLRGPVPPPVRQKMARIATRQGELQQQAEKLTLRLARHNLPSGDLEGAARAMSEVEQAAHALQPGELRQAYSRVLDGLAEARRTVRPARGLTRESGALPQDARRAGVQEFDAEGIPRGYEEIAGEYFRALARGTGARP